MLFFSSGFLPVTAPSRVSILPNKTDINVQRDTPQEPGLKSLLAQHGYSRTSAYIPNALFSNLFSITLAERVLHPPSVGLQLLPWGGGVAVTQVISNAGQRFFLSWHMPLTIKSPPPPTRHIHSHLEPKSPLRTI